MPSLKSSFITTALAVLTLTGCADYLSNRDSVTLGVGNAAETNVGVHTIEPFPPAAWDTEITSDGHAVARAQRAYDRGTVVVPPPPATMTNATSGTN